jgi:hypothetical protein
MAGESTHARMRTCARPYTRARARTHARRLSSRIADPDSRPKRRRGGRRSAHLTISCVLISFRAAAGNPRPCAVATKAPAAWRGGARCGDAVCVARRRVYTRRPKCTQRTRSARAPHTKACPTSHAATKAQRLCACVLWPYCAAMVRAGKFGRHVIRRRQTDGARVARVGATSASDCVGRRRRTALAGRTGSSAYVRVRAWQCPAACERLGPASDSNLRAPRACERLEPASDSDLRATRTCERLGPASDSDLRATQTCE